MPRGLKSDGSAGSRVANATRLRRDLESRRTGRSSTPEALNISSGFHTDLIRSGYMKVKWHAGVVTVLKIESKDGTRILNVPIFWDFFKRDYRKDCAICAETYSDVISDTPEDRASWEKILVDFPGPWPLRVRHFPPQSVLPECAKHHALDICIKCISRYMKQQVHSARGPVKCFMPDCGQVYAQKQVKLLAGAKAFRRWEKLQLAAVLSGQEGFLWCLRPGCRNGQIHDVPRLDDSIPEVNKIDCNHCGFLMCFKHQRAWHDGMTCREFDNFHLHGDPSIAETERLLRQ
ncbi:uncharacterized protein DNG_07301 [Cephalotrichum gorgonifer]|uniref:IBR domain-containing protein n=1 Tax=Cephalotrichum gorgonifer TaxID=2041049 RepID=A0AAE8N1E3_9PEZI|nr:uncharacterized protein DNG_07301 [Cephalotrichum gorgonifer]